MTINIGNLYYDPLEKGHIVLRLIPKSKGTPIYKFICMADHPRYKHGMRNRVTLDQKALNRLKLINEPIDDLDTDDIIEQLDDWEGVRATGAQMIIVNKKYVEDIWGEVWEPPKDGVVEPLQIPGNPVYATLADMQTKDLESRYGINDAMRGESPSKAKKLQEEQAVINHATSEQLEKITDTIKEPAESMASNDSHVMVNAADLQTLLLSYANHIIGMQQKVVQLSSTPPKDGTTATQILMMQNDLNGHIRTSQQLIKRVKGI